MGGRGDGGYGSSSHALFVGARRWVALRRYRRVFRADRKVGTQVATPTIEPRDALIVA